MAPIYEQMLFIYWLANLFGIVNDTLPNKIVKRFYKTRRCRSALAFRKIVLIYFIIVSRTSCKAGMTKKLPDR